MSPDVANSQRFGGLQLVTPVPVFAGLAEDGVGKAVRGREGAYRRGLGLADVLAALTVLSLVALFANRPDPMLLVALAPLIVLVNKIAGLYERDELVLNKTTLDETPSLLQITGLFTLLVWMTHAALSEQGLAPTSVLMLWASLLAVSLVGRTAARRAAAAWAGAERCLVIGT